MNSIATFIALLIAVFMATSVPSAAAAMDAGGVIMLITGLIIAIVLIFAILGCVARRGQASSA